MSPPTADPLRVIFDLTPVLSGRTGVARYTAQLTRGLSGLGVEVDGFALGRGRSPLPAGIRHHRWPLRVVQASWSRTGWPRAESLGRVSRADLVHSADLIAPPTRLPLVMTIHDTAAVDHPQWHDRRSVEQQRRRLGQARDEAGVVLANSAATAADLVRHGVDSERIVVTPLGVTDWSAGNGARPSEEAGHGAPEAGYVLFVGETHPRKDIPTLIRALGRLGERPRLVLAGPAGAAEEAVGRVADECGVETVRLHYVTDAAMPGLLTGASVLALPSRAEGFGLPVLEAMAAGVPVVVTPLPALEELAGPAAVYAPVGDADAWAAALDAVLSDPSRRSDMARAGRQWAVPYTWDRTAAATVAAYRRLVDPSSSGSSDGSGSGPTGTPG